MSRTSDRRMDHLSAVLLFLGMLCLASAAFLVSVVLGLFVVGLYLLFFAGVCDVRVRDDLRRAEIRLFKPEVHNDRDT